MTRLDRVSESHARALYDRTSTYADGSKASWEYTQDRVKYRPVGKTRLLRWAQRQAAMDGPIRLHGRDIADDGAPKMTAETQKHLGMTGDDTIPTNWLAVACQVDEDGNYVTPMRAAIARIHTRRPKSAAMLRVLVTEFCDEASAVGHLADPEVAQDVVEAALNRLYDTYCIRPMATKVRNEVLAS